MNNLEVARERHNRVFDFVSNYFERMPPVSRVTYDELVPYVCVQCNYSSPPAVRSIITEVVNSRNDLIVNRGRGICKQKR